MTEVTTSKEHTPTLVDWLHRAKDSPESGLRFVDRRERAEFVPWSSTRKAALKVAGSLAALGVEPGERVALVFPTGAPFFEAFFGVLLAGAVPVPLYPPVRLGRLDEYHRRTAAMLDAASAKLLLADAKVLRLLGSTVEQAGLPLGCRKLTQLPAAGEFAHTPSCEDFAMVQFSSGTTVDPKPVALRHRHVAAQVQALNRFWPDTPELRHTGVSWLPLYHDMGLIGCVFPALERMSVMTLIGPEVFVARPAIWLRTLSKYRATISVAPNFAYGLCVDKIRDQDLVGIDLSAWQVALNGAESVSPSVLRGFQERFAAWGLRPEALTPVYGLSEATLAVTFSDLDSEFMSRFFDRRRLAEGDAQECSAMDDGVEMITVGQPLHGTEVCVADSQAVSVVEGKVGRVLVRGPSVMDGYLDRPDATARVFEAGGWLDTGDLGFLWQRQLYLTGRAKDVLIIRGRNHQPEEVEQAIEGQLGLRAGCAVAVSHRPPGGETEEVLLFVEKAQDADPSDVAALPERCQEAVLSSTGLRVSAVHVEKPGTLPRTSSGKLRRAESLRRYLAGELDAPAPVTPLRLVGAMAKGAAAHARARRQRREQGGEGSDG